MSQQGRSLFAQAVVLAAVVPAATFVTGLGVLPAAGARALGVNRFANTAAGQTGTVDVLGSAFVRAGAAFAADTLLMLDAQGRVITWTAGNTAVARALQAASGAEDLPEVLLIAN